MANNIFQTKTPIKPKVLAQERVYVYVPLATTNTRGIAAYDSKDFNLSEGIVKIKRNNPFVTESLVKLNNTDFTNTDGVINILWPKADTQKYGLVKLKADGYLKVDANGLLDADYTKFKTDLEENVKPIYGGKENGFTKYEEYVDGYGIARKDDSGNILLSLTKEAIGLNKVENRAFSDYTYDNFGDNVKAVIDEKLAKKLDKTTWNTLFNDWMQKNEQIATPHSWLEYLDAQQESIKDSLGTASLFLGFFETIDQLQLAYPAGEQYEKSMAYITATKTYWAVRKTDAGYEWYNTRIDDGNFYDRMETDPNALREAGLVPSIGSSGKWVQSDHVHPGDSRKLNKNILQSMTLNVTSDAPSEDDFVAKFWNKDASGAYAENPMPDISLNIPYVRTGQYLHNWAGSINHFDGPKNETYWAASASEFDELDIEAMPNGSLIIVDDGENAEAGVFVNEAQLLRQGIEISGLSRDRFVITNKDRKTDGMLLTTYSSSNKVSLKAMTFTHPETAGRDPMLVVKPGANGNTVSEKYFAINKLLKASVSGTPEESSYNAENVLRTSDGDFIKVLESNRLLVSGDDNVIDTFNTGSIENKLLATDGLGGIKPLTLEGNKLVMTGINGELSYFTMTAQNAGKVIGVSNDGNPTLLSQTEIPTSLPIKTFDTNPTVAQASTVLVFADPEGVYMDGCLYMY